MTFGSPLSVPILRRQPLDIQRLPLQARPCFPTPGGGSKSQARDIRCLTFAPPPFDPDLAKLSCNIPCFWPKTKNSYHFWPQIKNSYHFWPQIKNSYHFWAPNRLLATGFSNFPRMCFRLPQGCRKGGPKNKVVCEKNDHGEIESGHQDLRRNPRK